MTCDRCCNTSINKENYTWEHVALHMQRLSKDIFSSLFVKRDQQSKESIPPTDGGYLGEKLAGDSSRLGLLSRAAPLFDRGCSGVVSARF